MNRNTGFAGACRDAAGEAWDRAVRHPFVLALAAGGLTPRQITTYLEQDALYLASYVQTCRTLATLADGHAERDLFRESARLAEEAERGMQDQLGTRLGLALQPEPPVLAATRDYRAHERAPDGDGHRLTLLAAATPCTWVYADIGSWLISRLDGDLGEHPYEAWISLYAGPEVQTMADRWIACLNDWAASAGSGHHAPACKAFARSVTWEIAFWDQAWFAA